MVRVIWKLGNQALLFWNGNAAGSRYKRMLRYFLLPKIRDHPESMIFQQDEAFLHYDNKVREYLARKLPGRWIGRGWPISWPARYPDLTPFDYYLWEHIKDIVYQDPPQTINELKTKIWEAIRVISEDTLKWFLKTWNSSELRYTWKKRTFRTCHELNNNFSKQSTLTCD